MHTHEPNARQSSAAVSPPPHACPSSPPPPPFSLPCRCLTCSLCPAALLYQCCLHGGVWQMLLVTPTCPKRFNNQSYSYSYSCSSRLHYYTSRPPPLLQVSHLLVVPCCSPLPVPPAWWTAETQGPAQAEEETSKGEGGQYMVQAGEEAQHTSCGMHAAQGARRKGGGATSLPSKAAARRCAQLNAISCRWLSTNYPLTPHIHPSYPALWTRTIARAPDLDALRSCPILLL